MYAPALLSLLAANFVWAVSAGEGRWPRGSYLEPDSLGGSFGSDVFARSFEYPRAFVDLARRKGPKLLINMSGKRGSMKPDEIGDTRALGEAVMESLDIKEAEIAAGWHGEGTTSQDPIQHFSMKPLVPDNSMIHVRWDGSWSQGPNGKENAGKVDVKLSKKNQAKLRPAAPPAIAPATTVAETADVKPKQARRGVEAVEARALDATHPNRSWMLVARHAYMEALPAILQELPTDLYVVLIVAM